MTKKKKYSPKKALMVQLQQKLKNFAIVCVFKGDQSEPTCIDYRTGEALAISEARELQRIFMKEAFRWEVACVACGVTPFKEKYVQDVLIRAKAKYRHDQMQPIVEAAHTQLFEQANMNQITSLVWITRPIPTNDGMTENEILNILTSQDAWNPLMVDAQQN